MLFFLSILCLSATVQSVKITVRGTPRGGMQSASPSPDVSQGGGQTKEKGRKKEGKGLYCKIIHVHWSYIHKFYPFGVTSK